VSIAKRSARYTGLFEAELLLELMLRYWQHPLADEREFRNELLEKAAEALRTAAQGQQLIEELPAGDTNLVAAIWYVEWAALSASHEVQHRQAREDWLERVRRSLPSCFCDPSLLDEN
jgi:hypothetical protein